MAVWQIQEAKAKLSEFVNEAMSEPQIISKHGKPEVIAMSIDMYNKITNQKSDIVSFFRNSPLCGVNLEIDRDKTEFRIVQL